MIAFASLFLGLVFGTRPVEMVVGADVAAVELRLDGERVAVMREPPWRAPVDFGSELAPRHLEAVAFDADDGELERVSQWLNLPQPGAVASVVLEPRKPGEPRVARITWESAAGAEPESVSVSLDGVPLTVDDLRRFVLPEVDETELHLLHVDMDFEGRVSTRLDVTFGGAYTDQVSTEITALPLLADKRGTRPPTPAEARGWFVKDGEPLEVLAVEKETAEVVVVMDRPFPQLHEPGKRYKVPKALYLGADQRLRFATTVSKQSEGVATTFELFPMSSPFGGNVGDVYGMLTRIMRPPQDREARPIAAVAVAGLAAYGGRHRRAVVLIPSSHPRDEEALSAEQVRRYLDRLGVPLFVWEPRRRPGENAEIWGEVETVGTLDELADAFAEVSAHLERQWIVWLDGLHLPQEVRTTPDVEGFRLLVR